MPMNYKKKQFTKLKDIRLYLAYIINEVNAGKMPDGRAKTLIYACNTMHSVMKTEFVETKLRQMEEQAGIIGIDVQYYEPNGDRIEDMGGQRWGTKAALTE